MIRRKTNRRHMTGDHHGLTAGRATLLVTATDEILGTHKLVDVTGCSRWLILPPAVMLAFQPQCVLMEGSSVEGAGNGIYGLHRLCHYPAPGERWR
jgi:hypothetical protein